MNGVKIFSENFTENTDSENSKPVGENKAEKKEKKGKAFSISLSHQGLM